MVNTPSKKTDVAPNTEDRAKPFEEAIDQQIGNLVPQKARDEVVSRISTLLMSEHFSGPIAHPKHLQKYEDVCPGAADRIISMAENQQAHNASMDHKVVEAEVNDRKFGMILGALSFAALIACALITSLFTDSEVIPGLFLGAAALGGVAHFIKGRSNGSN